MSQPSIFDFTPEPPAETFALGRAEQIQRLREVLTRASAAYYNTGNPIMSDTEFDGLQAQLAELESKHPELKTETSPPLVVGAPAPSGSRRNRHLAPMLSLQNAMSSVDLAAFADRAGRYLRRDEPVSAYAVEIKLDGLALSLTYAEGALVRATTRGDGEEGEDVTAQALRIPTIPKRLNRTGWTPDLIEVRGEVVLPYAQHEALNAALESEGEEGYDNPRNAASGILRDEDPTNPGASYLTFYAYALQTPVGQRMPFASHTQVISEIVRWGFSTSPIFRTVRSIADAEAACLEIFGQRRTLPFMIDGAVVKIDSLDLQADLGAAGKNPRWAIARKEKGETAQTRLLDIDMRPGRTGAITPRALLEPVACGGVIVSKATLHNADEIQRLDIRIGDRVVLERRGDVIPMVVQVLYDERDGTEQPWRFPTECPSCAGLLHRPTAKIKKGKDGAPDEIVLAAATYCDNATCPDQRARRIEHFGHRTALEIRGLGEEVAQQLAGSGAVTSVADLYSLTIHDLLKVDGFAQTKAQNLLNAISATKEKPFARVLVSLGIRHVGKTASKLFVAHFRTIDNLLAAPVESLEAIEQIGPKIARAWREWADRDDNRHLLARLRAAGLRMEAEEQAVAQVAGDSPFVGKTVVITGTHPYRREQIEKWLTDAGARVSGSVTGSTDYLIAGEKAGSKLARATKLGVTALSWEQAIPLFGSALPDPLPPLG